VHHGLWLLHGAPFKTVFRLLCSAVCYLHSRSFVHRDIKPDNMLLPSQDRSTMIPLLADFGISKQCVTVQACNTFCGTPAYFAPEIISSRLPGGGYGLQVDMWALGVTLYVFLSGVPPFEDDLYGQILSGGVRI